ncbi:MAG: DUF2238 domain-containing protein [Planctomycetota bacterium]|jgi:hypothetical protein
MQIKKGQLPILISILCALAVFSAHFVTRKNYEFIIYVGVIAFFLILFILTNEKVYYPNSVLWGLVLWAIMHMAGGSVHINGTLLYKIMIVPLSQNYPVFRYDQLVHIIGFGVATLTLFYLLRPLLIPNVKGWSALSIILVAAGFGVGAFNEVVEFIVSSVVPESNVGGYLNTSLDLVSDLIGAVLALVVIRFTNRTVSTGQ